MTSHTQLRKRRSAIIHELARLSRNGWHDARSFDYQPLETELRHIDARLTPNP